MRCPLETHQKRPCDHHDDTPVWPCWLRIKCVDFVLDLLERQALRIFINQCALFPVRRYILLTSRLSPKRPVLPQSRKSTWTDHAIGVLSSVSSSNASASNQHIELQGSPGPRVSDRTSDSRTGQIVLGLF